MGLFGFFKKVKLKKEPVAAKEERGISETALSDRQARIAFIESNCEIAVSADKQIVDSRKEYEVVTSYLSDIQKIDSAKPEDRKKIDECANKVINLNKERMAMTHTPPKITGVQRLAIEQEEDRIEAEIKKMADSEAYKILVEKDLDVLERERDSLDTRINRAISKTEFNRKLLTVASVFIVIALIALITARLMTNADITTVFSLIIAFGALAAGYLLFVHRRTLKEMKSDEAKLGRAITLLNKTKIKYVNVTNLLDYNCEKYHVTGAQDLSFNWKEYNRLVEEERRFKKAEQLIDLNEKDLKDRLKALGVNETGIWVYQCEALVDAGEMVEVRHRLNVRRQKLRKAIDYNTQQKKSALLALQSFVVKHREYEFETNMVMERYGLTNQ